MLDAALATEVEVDVGALDVDVTLAQRGQAEGAVGPGILLVADADERHLEEAHHRRQHLLPAERRLPEARLDARADPRQHLGEGHHALVFRLVAHRAKRGW